VEPAWRTAVGAVAGLVSSGDSIDELGLAALTDGCYFVSVSPERVKALHEAFGRLDRRALATLYGRGNIATPAEAEFLSYLDQWRAAVRFAQERGLGLIGHCG
jgi:hypothetical protein